MASHSITRIRGGCARVIECNRSSSAHHRVCTFFPSPLNPVGKGSGHAQATRDMAERQSPDGNKRPRGYSHLSDAGKTKQCLFMKYLTKGNSFSHKSLMATPTQRMQLRYVHAQPPLTRMISDNNTRMETDTLQGWRSMKQHNY